MKTNTKKKLALATQTIRTLREAQLVDAGGAWFVVSAFCTRAFGCTSALTC